MTFIGKIIKAIASIFTSAEKEVQKVIIPAAIAVTNFIKGISVLDTTDIIGSIAGAAGKAFEDKLRTALPGIVANLQLAQAFLDSNPTPEELVTKVLTAAKNLTGDTRINFLIELTGLITKALADGKITVAEAVIISQAVYHDPATIAAA